MVIYDDNDDDDGDDGDDEDNDNLYGKTIDISNNFLEHTVL